MRTDNVYYQILQDNCRDAIARGVRNWAYNFLSGLCRIGYPRTKRCDTLISVDRRDPPTVPSLLAALSDMVWQGLSISHRTWPSRGAQLARTYIVLPGQVCWPLGSRSSGCLGFGVRAYVFASGWFDVVDALGYLARSVYAPGVLCMRWGTSVTSYSRVRRYKAHSRLVQTFVLLPDRPNAAVFVARRPRLCCRFIADCFDNFQSGRDQF